MIKKFLNDTRVLIRLILQQIKQGSKEIEVLEYDNHQEINQVKFSFEEFKKNNLVYPEIKNIKNRFFELEFEYEVDKLGNAINIQVSKNKYYKKRTLYQKVNFCKTNKKEFKENSLNLIKKFAHWKPYFNKGSFVKGKFLKSMYFCYHKDYFNSPLDFCLNPEKKAKYLDKNNSKYQHLINCKNGSEGVVNLLCIVEKNGDLSNFELIGNGGKIGYDQVIKELFLLGKWQPATNRGEVVRSQLDLLIYI